MSSAARRTMQRLTDTVLDVVFPKTCFLCHNHHDHGDPFFCPSCRWALRREQATPACPRCAHSTGVFGIQDGKCNFCRHTRPPVDAVVRAGLYHDAMGELIRAMKFGGRDDLNGFAAQSLASAVRQTEWVGKLDALVCVPTHWRHSLFRPFYAPTFITLNLSRLLGTPAADVLKRTAAGPHQFEVPRNKRMENIKGKFALHAGAGVENATLCVVDDVSTTGATICECARVLKRSGATRVYAAVVAKVDSIG